MEFPRKRGRAKKGDHCATSLRSSALSAGSSTTAIAQLLCAKGKKCHSDPLFNFDFEPGPFLHLKKNALKKFDV